MKISRFRSSALCAVFLFSTVVITSLDVASSASACGIPAIAQAHVLSVTVVPPGSLGNLTLWPQGQTRPGVSTLNALDGAITSINAYASNPAHVIIHTSGYFGQ